MIDFAWGLHFRFIMFVLSFLSFWKGKDSAMQDKKEEKPAKPPKEYEVEAIVDYVKDEVVCNKKHFFN